MVLLLKMVTGLAIAYGLGFIVSRILSSATPAPEIPKDKIPAEAWNQLTKPGTGGKWIGTLERFLSLAAFWTGNPSLVAGWLAFKVASKWEVWKNIVQVPPGLEGISAVDWFGIRHVYGSWILTRFWIGTLANVLAGLVAAYLASHSDAFWFWFLGLVARFFS
jgi:hypothetical protein